MKYKVGDKVRIKSIDWYNENKDKDGIVVLSTHIFVPGMSQFCGKIVTIENVFDNSYDVKEDNDKYYWTDEMIEELVEEETTSDKVIEEAKTYWDSIKDAWICPDGYIFKDENGNVINARKIVLEKKKKEYPKTYEECCEIVHSDPKFYVDTHLYSDILETLYKLLICRDAYWKIAGDEMGLGKPWEPTKDKMVYSIYRHSNEIETDIFSGESVTFEFPTPEMRDAFKKNFDPDIEICKELL